MNGKWNYRKCKYMLIMFNKHNVHARKEAGFWGRESRPTDTKTFPAQTQTLRPAQSISMSTFTAVPIHLPSAHPHMGSELLCLSISVHTISIPHDSCFTGLTTALPSIKEPKSTGQEGPQPGNSLRVFLSCCLKQNCCCLLEPQSFSSRPSTD